jgi:hypothetical protein
MAEKSAVKEDAVMLAGAAVVAVVAADPPVVVVVELVDDFPQATKPMVRNTVVDNIAARLSE